MNIRKHLKRILLASTAIFWVSCNDDAQSSRPQTEIPNELSQCYETEKVAKQKFNTDIMNDPVAYAKESAEKSAQIAIRDSIEQYVAVNALRSESEKNADSAPECLLRMIDTLEVPVFLYGVLYDQDSIATKRECDDGTTYIRDEYLRYEDDVKRTTRNTRHTLRPTIKSRKKGKQSLEAKWIPASTSRKSRTILHPIDADSAPKKTFHGLNIPYQKPILSNCV